MPASRLSPIVLVAALVAAALVVCGTVCAGVIGVNFVGRASYSDSVMDPAETAGAVVQANWNNASGGVGTLSALVDETGTVTGAGVQWRSEADYLGIANTPGDRRLMRGHVSRRVDEAITVTVRGLDTLRPGGLYDVLVYFDAWNPAVDWAGTYAIGNHVLVGTDRAGTHFDGAFVEDAGPGGNYVRFRDLTADTFTLTVEVVDGSGGSVAVNALQVVHTPEPATLALLAVGLAAGLLRRRRA